MTSAGARAPLFLRQKLPFEGTEVVIVSAKPEEHEAARLVDTDEHPFTFVDDVKKAARRAAPRVRPTRARPASRPRTPSSPSG
jgi:hypothetical protein